tara:strand:+ start:1318 stop:1905 length:588 start_codon:yes stop_codon:yes gene_type:complete
MATFYDIYQSYLQNPYGGVNAVSGVSEVQGIGQPNQGIMNLIPQTSDGGDEGGGVPPGPTTGPGGITQAFDQYQGLSNFGKLGTTMALNAFLPGAGTLLGIAGLGTSAYNGLLGGLNTTGFGNFTGGLFGAPEGRDEFGKSMNVGDVESGLSGLGGSYSGTAAQQEALMSEMSSGHGGSNDPGNTSGGFGGDDDE